MSTKLHNISWVNEYELYISCLTLFFVQCCVQNTLHFLNCSSPIPTPRLCDWLYFTIYPPPTTPSSNPNNHLILVPCLCLYLLLQAIYSSEPSVRLLILGIIQLGPCQHSLFIRESVWIPGLLQYRVASVGRWHDCHSWKIKCNKL